MLRDEEHRETAGELPTRLIYAGERYGTEAGAFSSGLAVMDRYREMVRADGPIMEDDISMGTDECSLEEGTRTTTLLARVFPKSLYCRMTDPDSRHGGEVAALAHVEGLAIRPDRDVFEGA